jgi:hypothetical protein
MLVAKPKIFRENSNYGINMSIEEESEIGNKRDDLLSNSS